MSPAAFILSLPIRAYRLIFSPWVGFNCRYQPTCSAYALEALQKHGAFKGGWIAAKRIARCNPWGSCGYDPVPDTKHDCSTHD
ncbi:membrane protein insertion efficiency factor YidD [Aliiroseovarius marinus]|jgi:uncharacterized protein|uniref:membrane protein insertion efficiency factor YidD n=1 Tax=Aliiroseovarius marinus TaxID=2500159 RepID=UPI00105FA7F1|nr:membrane protein insertion efficiency factor YidD [Aliiroseovarius marinus]